MSAVSTYSIIKIFIDFKLSLATSSSFIKFAEQFQCVAQNATCLSFTSFITNYPLHNKQVKETNNVPGLKILQINCYC